MREAERCDVRISVSVHSHCSMDVHRITLFDEDQRCSVRHGASSDCSSTRAASSVYSNLLMRIALSTSRATIRELATSCSLNILSMTAMKHTGGHLLQRVLDILSNRFLPVFGIFDTGKGWHSQVCPCAIGGINTCHKMRHNLSLPTVTYICMRELPHFHHGPTTSFPALSADSDSSKWTRTHLCRWSSVHLG